MRPGLPPKGSNRNGGASLTSTQRDSTGKRSDWSRPADLEYRLSVTANESRWSQTVNNRSI